MGRNTDAKALHLVGVYLWWWPADEAVDSPASKQQLYTLVVRLANARAAAIREKPGRGARRAEPFMTISVEVQKELERRVNAANAFQLVAQECLQLGVSNPGIVKYVKYAKIQECVQQRTSGDPDLGESRGILVVRHRTP